jgi:RHS repeat-associated protein
MESVISARPVKGYSAQTRFPPGPACKGEGEPQKRKTNNCKGGIPREHRILRSRRPHRSGVFGNNVVTDNSFDANTGRLLNICATTSAGSCNGNVANLSYDWDSIGNLTDRADTYEGYTEEFCYDNLNRLVNYAIASTCTSSGDKTVAYDSLGDISSKSDVGTYTYPTSGSGSGRPHAVSSIAGTVNGVVNPTFTYDANGNMTAGDGRTVTYTSFNMAASVSEGTTTLGFLYDSEHRRYEQCIGGCTSPTSTTTYLDGPAMSEKAVSGTNVTWNDYIAADGALVAERVNNAGTVSLLYFTGDHLGSTSVLTNASGAVVERDSYDAFGKRRNANGTDNTACSITSASTRGYTAQEMMDSVCLTNMNARLYDQTIGRFQSADSIVPDATDGQDFNRYSYVGNNPLDAIDPTGHGGIASRLGPEAQTKIVSPNGDVPNDDDNNSPGEWNFSIEITNGSTTTTIPLIGTLSDLANYLNSLGFSNAGYNIATDVSVQLDGLANATIDYNPSSVTVIDGGYSSTTYGLGRVSTNINSVDPVIFINGFDAQGTVNEYIDHLLQNRPDLRGHVSEFSYLDNLDDIVKYAKGLSGPITLIGNSLGAANAAQIAVACGCVTTLVTLAPVGPLDVDYSQIADSVTTWIDLRTPIGIADVTALFLSHGSNGPWGYGPQSYATTFIDSSLGHAQFWNQMDAACGYDMRGC